MHGHAPSGARRAAEGRTLLPPGSPLSPLPAGWACTLRYRLPLSFSLSLSAGWAALLSPIASDTLALPTSPPPDGLPSSEPRSMRADVIPGSERRATFATRQRGGGARRVDRGRRVVHLWSAEPRSVRDQPPAPARVTRFAWHCPLPARFFFLYLSRCTPLKNANIFLCLKTYLTLIKTGGG